MMTPTPSIPLPLTHVELTWIEKKTERWLRFGRSAQRQILDRRRSVESFTPGSVFGFVRWAGNDYGTTVSRIDIVRAVAPGEAYQTLPCITPGGDILLHLDGWKRVQRVLLAIDAIEALGIDPADAAPDYWRHLHNRLLVNVEPRTYTRQRHKAWLARRDIMP